MEPFKSLMRLWVRNKSIPAIWLENVVTPLIDPAIKGFAAAPAVLKPERLKVDRTRSYNHRDSCYKNHGSPLISINTAYDQVEFQRISLTGFRSCASRSQTGASQSRQGTE
nr:hypothetical protein [Tanacetum cinerariifolium]